MPAVLYRLRAELHRGWRSLVVIALLVALSGGAALGSLAAARRTDTAFARMRTATDAWDLLINPNNGSESKLTMAELRRMPGVERIGEVGGLIVDPSIVKSVPDAFNLPPLLVAMDRSATYAVGRPLMVAGHQPSPGDPNGVWVERSFANQYHLRVGQTFSLVILTPPLMQQLQTATSEAKAESILHDAPATQHAEVRIDGIGVTSDDVVVDPSYTPGSILFTPAFLTAHPGTQTAYWGAVVKLAPGTDVDAFTASVQALVPHESIAFQRASAVASDVDDATQPEVLALEAFAALAALLGLVVVSQAVSRRMQLDARQNPVLAAMGTSRAQRMAVSLAKATLAIAVGAVLAVGVAVAVSPLGPVGAVRVAEVHPGVAFDGPVLLLGAAAILLVGAALAAISAWRFSAVAAIASVTARSRVAGAIAAAGGSLAAVVGVRFGLEPGVGRTSVPVRTTLLAAATAVALVTAVLVFSGSLDHLLATPRLYGASWDGQIELDNLNSPAGFNDLDQSQLEQIQRQFVDVADRSGSVSASALVDVGEVRSGHVAIPAIGYVERMGSVVPTIDQGRAPSAPDEVALGAITMARLHTHIGDTIELAAKEVGANHPVTVVGRAVLPGLAPYPGSDKAGLGVGAVFTQAGWARYSADFQKIDYMLKWAPHASVATLSRAFAQKMPSQLPLTVTPADHPAGVVSLQRLRSTPTILASLVAVLLAAAVANALVVAVRRRRRDLAVLRTLGFTRAQVVRTVLWQATTVGVVAVIVGIPLGVVIGRWTWNGLAVRLGTVPVPTASVPELLVLAVAVLVLANLVGLVPGLRAARHPGQVLRTE
jgi:hypothetical protein